MNRRINLLWFFALLLCSVSFADCVVNENCTWLASVSDGNNFYNSSEAKITIHYPNGSVFVNNADMLQLKDEHGSDLVGRYYYINSSNISGNYYSYAYFYNNESSIIAKAEEEKEIRSIELEESILGMVINNWFWIVILLLVIVFISILYYINK